MIAFDPGIVIGELPGLDGSLNPFVIVRAESCQTIDIDAGESLGAHARDAQVPIFVGKPSYRAVDVQPAAPVDANVLNQGRRKVMDPTAGDVCVPVGPRSGTRVSEFVGVDRRYDQRIPGEHEPPIGAVVVTEVVVHFAGVVILRQGVRCAVDEVVPRGLTEVARLVGRGIEIRKGLAQRVNPALGNDVVRERIARQRIFHRIGAV